MDKKEAYKIVFEDLKQQCSVFTGHYDAVHGNEHFMYGVSMVMESIAYRVDDSTGMNFENEFTDNMIESEEKAKKVKRNETH